jgi:predicted thioredoxin/glutaredoxin
MKRTDILAEVREIRPNEYQDEWALKQVDDLKQRILRELMDGYIIPDEGGELLTPSPYHNVYTYWLLAQIDLAQAEYDRYNNDLQLFNAAWEELSRHISRSFKKDHYRGFRV